MRRNTTHSARLKIKEFEGLRLKAYRDSGGVYTIGYGHTGNIPPNMKISIQDAQNLFENDIEHVDLLLSHYQLNQNQHDALADFVYNCGWNALMNSTLWQCVLSQADEKTISKQFRRWVYCKRQKLQALVIRREWEISRFFGKK